MLLISKRSRKLIRDVCSVDSLDPTHGQELEMVRGVGAPRTKQCAWSERVRLSAIAQGGNEKIESLVPRGCPVRITRVVRVGKRGKLTTDGLEWRGVCRVSPLDVDESDLRIVNLVLSYPISRAGDMIERPDIIVGA